MGSEKLSTGVIGIESYERTGGCGGRTCIPFLWGLHSPCSNFSSPQPGGYFLHVLPRPALSSVVAISRMWLFKLKYQLVKMKYN